MMKALKAILVALFCLFIPDCTCPDGKRWQQMDY